MKKIVGFNNSDTPARGVVEPRFHLDLDRNEPWSSSSSSKRLSPHVAEASGINSEASERNVCGDAVGEDELSRGYDIDLTGSCRGTNTLALLAGVYKSTCVALMMQ